MNKAALIFANDQTSQALCTIKHRNRVSKNVTVLEWA